MTNKEAAEVLRLQLVALTGIPDEQISHGPLDSSRRVVEWITLIPLATTNAARSTRVGDAFEQSRTATLLATSYGDGATDALMGAASTIESDTDEGVQALEAGVTLQGVSPSNLPVTVVRTAHEPRAAITITIGYVYTKTVNEPTPATSVIVDLSIVDGDTYPAAIVVEVP